MAWMSGLCLFTTNTRNVLDEQHVDPGCLHVSVFRVSGTVSDKSNLHLSTFWALRVENVKCAAYGQDKQVALFIFLAC